MLDIQDPTYTTNTQGLFSEGDWSEVKTDLPSAMPYASATSTYLDTVKSIKDLRTRLGHCPDDVELKLTAAE